jgi:ribonucleoside-diphosphate reductase alpha chain
MSVRYTDEFMSHATIPDADRFPLRAITTGKEIEYIDASELLDLAAECNLECGDPGAQFEDTIQRWHTCPAAAPINSSNPCSEYMFIDDSACNLASLNLMKFRRPGGGFDVDAFLERVDVAIVAQETLVDLGSYPTAAIARNSHDYRPLGLGLANLGCLLMCEGIPYGLPLACKLARVLAALLTARGYRQSAILARRFGPFPEYADNANSMMKVMENHMSDMYFAVINDNSGGWWEAASRRAVAAWGETVVLGRQHGYRNAQATNIAPTGTIAFMMGCDTFGAEPEIALVRHKALAGRGSLRLINKSVAIALEALGYSAAEIEDILEHIETFGTIQPVNVTLPDGELRARRSPIKGEHLPVFDCAYPPAAGTLPDGTPFAPINPTAISGEGHVGMIGTLTGQVSGAVSKTVNLPRGSTAKDIRDIYILAWRYGCKAVSVYVDGSKQSQPVTIAPPVAHGAEGPVMPLGSSRIESNGFAGSPGTTGPDWDAGAFYVGSGPPPAAPAGMHWREVPGSGGWGLFANGGGVAEPVEFSPVVTGHLPGVLNGVWYERDPRQPAAQPAAPVRRRMPDTRPSTIHKFSIVGHEGYITVGYHDDGTPGEVFIKMSKQGSTVGGLMDTIGTLMSVGLQYGVPLAKIVAKLEHQQFEPRGITKNPDIKFARSIIDYVGRWLGLQFIAGYRDRALRRGDGVTPAAAAGADAMDADTGPLAAPFVATIFGTACPQCGQVMARQGNCDMCFNCGYDDGGCG